MGKLAAIAALLAAQERHDSNFLRVATIAADTEDVGIGTETYTCVSADAEDFEFLPGGDADASATNLAAEINARNEQDLTAVAVSGAGVLVYSNHAGARGLACTETLEGSNNEWSAAAMYGGTTTKLDEEIRAIDLVAITPTAVEVAVGQIDRVFAFDVEAVIVDVRDTNGDAKAWDGATTVDGQRVTLDNSGSTDWSATDTVNLLVSSA